MAKSHKNGTAKKVGQGAAVAAAVAGAAAGAYYLYGSKGAKKHRKEVGAWVNKAKKEITSEAKKLSAAALNEKNYKKIASVAVDRYKDAESLTKTEAAQLVGLLVKEWKQMQSGAKPLVKKAKAVARKATSKSKK